MRWMEKLHEGLVNAAGVRPPPTVVLELIQGYTVIILQVLPYLLWGCFFF